MKIKKYVEDLKSKSAAELNEELVAAKKELFNLRFQNATNQLDNTSRIKEVRKNIARIQTVIAAVSYTHLDVYKRQHHPHPEDCGRSVPPGDAGRCVYRHQNEKQIKDSKYPIFRMNANAFRCR